MAKKIISKEHIKILENVPAVHKVTPSYITFMPAFKEKAVNQYTEGQSGWDIFLEAGFPAELLNPGFITDTLKRWRRTVRTSGIEALYRDKRGRPKHSRTYEAMTDAEKIAYLEAENAFLAELRARRQVNGLQ